jgi:hypothetical protein
VHDVVFGHRALVGQGAAGTRARSEVFNDRSQRIEVLLRRESAADETSREIGSVWSEVGSLDEMLVESQEKALQTRLITDPEACARVSLTPSTGHTVQRTRMHGAIADAVADLPSVSV